MLVDAPFNLFESAFQTGSSVICNPPVTDTDIDFMFYTRDMVKFEAHLLKAGWKDCGEYDANKEQWIALRKDNLNYILTNDNTFYEKFEEATTLATQLNLLQKQQRITLFAYVLGDTKKRNFIDEQDLVDDLAL